MSYDGDGGGDDGDAFYPSCEILRLSGDARRSNGDYVLRLSDDARHRNDGDVHRSNDGVLRLNGDDGDAHRLSDGVLRLNGDDGDVHRLSDDVLRLDHARQTGFLLPEGALFPFHRSSITHPFSKFY